MGCHLSPQFPIFLRSWLLAGTVPRQSLPLQPLCAPAVHLLPYSWRSEARSPWLCPLTCSFIFSSGPSLSSHGRDSGQHLGRKWLDRDQQGGGKAGPFGSFSKRRTGGGELGMGAAGALPAFPTARALRSIQICSHPFVEPLSGSLTSS